MASGTLLDLNAPSGSGPDPIGARPLLSRAHVIGLRVLIGVYGLTFALLLATNIRPVGDAVFRLSSTYLWVGIALGILVSATILTFFLLLVLCLHHFSRGHAGPKPAAWWFWVIVLLNVVGVVVYYVRVIEPDQTRLPHPVPEVGGPSEPGH